MIAQQPYLQFRLQDATGSNAISRVHVQLDTTVAASYSAAATWRGAVSAVSGCVIRDNVFVLPSVELLSSSAALASKDTMHGVFIFICAGTDQYAIVRVPGINIDLLATTGPLGGIEIDQTKPAVIALIEELTNGSWCNQFGYAIVELAAAYLQVTKNAFVVPAWLS